MSTRKAYPYDLTTVQWALIEPLLPAGPQPGPVGRPREVELREVVNAILSITRTGCQWNALPHDLPHFRTVLCLGTTANGSTTASGNTSPMACAAKYAKPPAARRNQPLPSSIANR
jgi:hypothetical protein